MKRDIKKLLFLLAIAVVIGLFLARVETTQKGSVKVVDGDSLEMNGEKIRLIGIDAPEFNQYCQSDSGKYSCGRAARRHLRKLIGNEPVTCINRGNDRYQRTLAICKVGATNINQTMVGDGWAVSFGQFERQEAEARKSRKGLWRGKFQQPADFRREKRALAENQGEHGPGAMQWISDLVKSWWP